VCGHCQSSLVLWIIHIGHVAAETDDTFCWLSGLLQSYGVSVRFSIYGMHGVFFFRYPGMVYHGGYLQCDLIMIAC
jgi:hypothetical protein